MTDGRAPWWHQEKEFDEHKDDKCRALLWSMRTGKTKAVIDILDVQFKTIGAALTYS